MLPHIIQYPVVIPKRRRYDWLVRLSALFAAMGLASLGVAFIARPVSSTPEPPMPDARTSVNAPATTAPVPAAAQQAAATTRAMSASQPARLTIDAIGVNSPVMTTGLDKSRAPVPPSGDDVDKAAWLKSSVTPGERGTSVIIGHVTTIKSGQSVFFNLGKLHAGQAIAVSRRDGTVARFVIEDVKAYNKSDFPSQTVYATTDYPSLRLITCSQWDSSAKSYQDNIVVYARLNRPEK